MDDPNDHEENPTLHLDDALKLAGAVSTGGAAKALIQSGMVRVNGEVETRRKRKLEVGDVVDVDGESFEVAWGDDDDEDDEGEAEDGLSEPSDAPWAEALLRGSQQLSTADLTEWRDWTIDRVAQEDLDAVLIRFGSLHPDALEALFALLPEEVEARVLAALDEVLERAAADDEEDDEERDGSDEAMQA
jgi:ribosome-associated protein